MIEFYDNVLNLVHSLWQQAKKNRFIQFFSVHITWLVNNIRPAAAAAAHSLIN